MTTYASRRMRASDVCNEIGGANVSALNETLGGVALGEDFANAGDDFGDAHRAVKDGGNGRQGKSFGARSDQNRRDELDQLLNSVIAGDFRKRFHDDGRRKLARGQGAARVVRGLHAERLDALLAELGADGGAQRPITRDYEYDWHPAAEV